MEAELLRKKNNASNIKEKAGACNDLATLYFKCHRYDDALKEFQVAANICKKSDFQIELATCNRMIGEIYMLKAEFGTALEYAKNYLAVAKYLKDLVEEERAIGTVGRIYLLQGQSSLDIDESKSLLHTSEKCFKEGLLLCQRLKGKIDSTELLDMQARLLLNIGVVQQCLESFDKAIEYIDKAIEICTVQKLYGVLHNCFTSKGLLYFNKKKDNAEALKWLNNALEVTDHLEDKVLKKCETLASQAEVYCKMTDYKRAKQVLLKAWKLKTPDEAERKEIESNLKVVTALCYIKDFIATFDHSDHINMRKLYEKLGDCACHLKNYSDAINYYLNMLEHAVQAGEKGRTLAPIYVSLYLTYKDMGKYEEALRYQEKEYNLIKDIPKEAYETLSIKAEILFLAKQNYKFIEKSCLEARQMAKKLKCVYSEIKILKKLLLYQNKCKKMLEAKKTLEQLKALGFSDFDNLDKAFDGLIAHGGESDITRITNDICLEILTDEEESEEDGEMEPKTIKKRLEFQVEMDRKKGQTQLHAACIAGNRKRVEKLISQGHRVNISYKAGCTPLHEACLYGHVDIVKLLIDNGANINACVGAKQNGITPLYDAACNGHLEVVKLLLENGAISSLKTDSNETPLIALQQWRKHNSLDTENEILFNNVCNLMQEE